VRSRTASSSAVANSPSMTILACSGVAGVSAKSWARKGLAYRCTCGISAAVIASSLKSRIDDKVCTVASWMPAPIADQARIGARSADPEPLP
jgi:hypothetical protein